jgi:undecaprenyl-diphosphatase
MNNSRSTSKWRERAQLRKRLYASAQWLRGQEPLMLLAVLFLVASCWAFISVTDEVLEGETAAFDRWVVRAMRQDQDPSVPIGPDWLQEAGRDATALGGIAWLAFSTLAVAGYLWIDRKFRLAAFLLGATTGGLAVSLALKRIFDRPRPDIVPHLSHVVTSSFPSGHSMLSAVVYLTLGALIATVAPRRRLKWYVIAVAMVLSMIVGVSRVYLGVHYPTDVLAGWMAGLVWALACWLVARWLQSRGRLEHDEQTLPEVPSREG